MFKKITSVVTGFLLCFCFIPTALATEAVSEPTTPSSPEELASMDSASVYSALSDEDRAQVDECAKYEEETWPGGNEHKAIGVYCHPGCDTSAVTALFDQLEFGRMLLGFDESVSPGEANGDDELDDSYSVGYRHCWVSLPDGLSMAQAMARLLYAQELGFDNGAIIRIERDAVAWPAGTHVVSPPFSDLKPGVDYVENELIVGFADDATLSEAYKILEDSSLEVVSVIDWTEPKVYTGGKRLLVTTGGRRTVPAAIQSVKMLNRELVRYAEPNMIIDFVDGGIIEPDETYTSPNAVINDPMSPLDTWYLESINAYDAWDYSQTSQSVRVAVLDTGIDFDHPDLSNNIDIVHARNVGNDASSPSLSEDAETHGTMVAGLVAACANNEVGIAGVSYNASVLPVKISHEEVLQDGSVEQRSSLGEYERAITYLNNLNLPNLRVVNISWTNVQSYINDYESLREAVASANQRGMVVVCAAGNDGANVSAYESSLPGVVSVIGVDQENQRVSVPGCVSAYGTAHDVSAPGQNIWSTHNPDHCPYAAYEYYGDYFAPYMGTSCAAPIVSGVLALMFAVDPSLSATEAVNILTSTAQDLGAPGFDEQTAWGLVDAEAAVSAVVARMGDRQSILGAEVAGVSDTYYTGYAVNPQPTVTLGGTTLQPGTDYIVQYSNNTDPGIAQVTVIGTGGYYGAVSVPFRIMSRWTRVSGSNGYATNQAVVDRVFPSGAQCDTAIVVTFSGFHDSLSAAALAGLYDAPILMTNAAELSPTASAEITRLGVDHVVVIGGPSAVQPDVVSEIEDLGVTVQRVYGTKAEDTAVAVAALGAGQWGDTAIVATGNSYYDSMAASPFAYSQGAPIFQTNLTTKKLSAGTVQAIQSGGFDTVLICGGTSAVSGDVESQLAGIQCVRLAGSNAYTTSSAIAEYSVQHGMDPTGSGVFAFSSWRDGLCAAMLCGSEGAPTVMVRDDHMEAIESGYVFNHRTQIDHGYIVGGTGAVSAAIETRLNNITIH